MATAMAWSLRTHRFTPLLLPAIVALACSGDDGDTAASTSSSTSPTTGLTTGTTQDYAIELKAGEYLYSCPLNPTPDYKLVVK